MGLICIIRGVNRQTVLDRMESSKSTITLTFGDVAENHTGMERIGNRLESGLSVADVKAIHRYILEEYGLDDDPDSSGIELIDLFKELNVVDYQGEGAVLLIITDGVQLLLGDGAADDLLNEQTALPYDTKAWLKGRVVNKKARYNLCFSDEDSPPNYQEKKGTVIGYSQVPVLNKLRLKIMDILKSSTDTAIDLKVESNYYYDTEKCYIGWHGDTERRVVIGCRLGAEYPLSFRWYHYKNPASSTMTVHLQHGDIYIMSEKVTGHDWKRPSIYTLRHSAGTVPLKK